MAVNGFQYCISPVSKPGESKTTGLSCGGNQGNYKVFSDYGLCLFWPFCCCFFGNRYILVLQSLHGTGAAGFQQGEEKRHATVSSHIP